MVRKYLKENEMHELSLAQSVLDIVEKEMKRHNGKELKAVTLTVGERAGVELNTFRTAIDAVLRASRWHDAVAKIDIIPSKAQCIACGAQFHPSGGVVECPECGSGACGIISGMEFKVSSLTIE